MRLLLRLIIDFGVNKKLSKKLSKNYPSISWYTSLSEYKLCNQNKVNIKCDRQQGFQLHWVEEGNPSASEKWTIGQRSLAVWELMGSSADGDIECSLDLWRWIPEKNMPKNDCAGLWGGEEWFFIKGVFSTI